MKKILSFAMAAVLLVAGCAKDVDSLNTGETVGVTFSAKLPIEVSRTVGDGSQATLLKYAIYSPEGELFGGYGYEDVTVQGNVATLKLDLVKGQSYKIAFWAQHPDAPYKFDRVAKTVTIEYGTESSNLEKYDAFYVVEPITVKGPLQKQITLRRPFAQINLGATKDDVQKAAALGVAIDKSKVTFTDVPTVLNLVDGTLGEETTNVDVTFDYNALPEGDLEVNDVYYEYIAANYILADTDTNVTNVTFSVMQGSEPINEDITVPAVSYKRNFRTNILGRLLTSSVDFNIVIDGTPQGDLELSDDAKLALAMQTEGEYTLTEDMTLSKPFVVEEGVNFTLNLNGKTLSAESGNVIKNYGTLILKGDVVTRSSSVSSVISNTTYGVNNSGILVVDGVKINAIYNAGELTFNDGIVENTISGRHGIYHCGSKLTINAGQFSSTSGNELIHAAVANATTINGGTFTQIGKSYLFGNGAAAIVINGGTFNGYVNDNGTNDKMRPGSAVVNGGTFNFDASAWVADGNKAVETAGKWVVVPANVDAVASTPAELDDALADGGNVVLGTDVESAPEKTAPYGNKYAFALNGGVLDGNGNELSMPCNGDHYGIMTTGGTVKNITIEWGCRAIMIMYPTEDVIVDNAKIGGDGVLYTINTGESGPAPVKLIVSNSTIAGWTSYGPAVESASFTNVKFEQGTYYNNIYGRVFKPYVNTTMTECSFVAHMNLDLSALVKGHKVVLKNCTVDGQPLTIDKIVIPQTDAQYDTELITVDLPGWATGIADCVSFE